MDSSCGHQEVDTKSVDQLLQGSRQAARSTVEGLRLSNGQNHALQAACKGFSLFFTGCGGCGKSFLLATILEELRKKYGEKAVFCTAMTGASAAAIGGQTIHSFSGIGDGEGSAEMLASKAGKGEARARWARCRALIIDEVSMMDGDLLTKLDFVARRVRNSQLPFGGIQLVLCGDLFQLPPVRAKKLVFESEAWMNCVQLHLELDGNFRQVDREFSSVLSRVRTGSTTPFDITYLQKLSRPLHESSVQDNDGQQFSVRPTRLYAVTKDVDKENHDALMKLAGPTVKFDAEDTGSQPELLRKCAAPATLLLRVGAQVMLVKNLSCENGLVNGARGVVVAFNADWDNAPIVIFNEGSGKEVTLPAEEFTTYQGGILMACRLQIPLQLAWACTIHKAQGCSLDSAIVDLKGVHQAGQVYVALSRVRSPQGLQLVNFAQENMKVDSRVKAFMNWVAKEGGIVREQVVRGAGKRDADDDGWTSTKRSRKGEDDF